MVGTARAFRGGPLRPAGPNYYRLGEAGDDDQRAGRMRGGHAGDDAERDEQAVLGAEHELADARKAPDPGCFAEGVLLDMPRRFGAGFLARNCVGGPSWRVGAFGAADHFAGLRPGSPMRSVRLSVLLPISGWLGS